MISIDDQEMVELARIWYRYGGPPADEILVRFGIGRVTFHRRVLGLISTRQFRSLLTIEDRTAIERVANGHIGITPVGRPARTGPIGAASQHIR